jgi:hypothetical protein
MALNQEGAVDDFYENSLMLGNIWLNRNQIYLNKMDIPIHIIRWDNWLNHKEYLNSKSKILAEISSDVIYKDYFDATITEYLTRYCKRVDVKNFNFKRARTLCFDYLVEECAGMCLWPQTQCEFEAYVSSHNIAMEETRKRFIQPNYPNLINPLSIEFNYRPNLRPQNFDLPNLKAIINEPP